MPDRPKQPDVEIGANVKAKKLRFEEIPEVEVRHLGDGATESERQNLPSDVLRRTNYRDVAVRWHARSELRSRR